MEATEKIQQTEADLARYLREHMDNPKGDDTPIRLLTSQLMGLYTQHNVPREERKF